MLRHTYGDVLPKWVTFSLKILHKGPILVKKILGRGSHFTGIEKKNETLVIFEVENPLEMSRDL